jgi:hypothetical protein
LGPPRPYGPYDPVDGRQGVPPDGDGPACLAHQLGVVRVARVNVRGSEESTRFNHHAARIASFVATVRFCD